MAKVNKRIEFLAIVDKLKEKLVSQQYIAKQLHVSGAAVSQWLHRKSLPQRNFELNFWKLKKILVATNRLEGLEKKDRSVMNNK
jgi:predicted transcriptional regulator